MIGRKSSEDQQPVKNDVLNKYRRAIEKANSNIRPPPSAKRKVTSELKKAPSSSNKEQEPTTPIESRNSKPSLREAISKQEIQIQKQI